MFKNVSRFDLKENFALNKLAGKKIQYMSVLIGFILLVFGLISYILMTEKIYVFLIIFGFMEIIIFVFFWNKILYKTVRKMCQTNSFIGTDISVEFTFEEDCMHSQTKRNEDVISENHIEYDKIFKVCEDDEYIFIFIGAGQSFIVSKSGMIQGNLNDLKQFLKSKIKNVKFKN